MNAEKGISVAPGTTAILQEIGKIRTELGAEWHYNPAETLKLGNENLRWSEWTAAFCLHNLVDYPSTSHYSQPVWEIGAKRKYPVDQWWANPEEGCYNWLGRALETFSTDVLNLPVARVIEAKEFFLGAKITEKADGQFEEAIASAAKRIVGQAGNPGEKVTGTNLLILTLKDMRDQLLPELLARSFAKKYDWKPNQLLNPQQQAELTHYACMMDKFAQAAVVDTAYELLHNEKAEQEYTMLEVKKIVEPDMQAIESELGLVDKSEATDETERASTNVAPDKPVVNIMELETFDRNVNSKDRRASFLRHPIHHGQSTADHLKSDLIAFLSRDVTLDQVRDGIDARMQTTIDLLRAFPDVHDQIIPNDFQI